MDNDDILTGPDSPEHPLEDPDEDEKSQIISTPPIQQEPLDADSDAANFGGYGGHMMKSRFRQSFRWQFQELNLLLGSPCQSHTRPDFYCILVI